MTRQERWFLAGLLFLGAAVRLWGIDFGLPHAIARPDEELVISTAVKFGSGDFNPHFFWYPTVYLYALFGAFGGYFAVGLITGRYASQSNFITEYAVNPSNFFIIDRMISALAGLATVLVVFHLARRLFGPRVALISAFFLALAYLHVRDSHFGTVDIAMTFMIMTAVFFFVKCYEAKTWKSYLWAAIMAGLATSIKYNALLLLAPMFIVHTLNVLEERRRWIFIFADRRLWLFGAVYVLAFVAGTPYALLDFRAFGEGLLGTLAYLNRGHGIDLGRGWWYHLKFSLWIGMGWSLLLASFIGLFLAAGTNLKKAFILYSFPILYYLVVGNGHTVFLRYALPLVPFLCISAAGLMDKLASVMAGRVRPALQGRLAFALAALFVLPSALRVAKFDALLGRTDNREIAAGWLDQNIPPDASIFQTGIADLGEIKLLPSLASLQGTADKKGIGIGHQARIEFMQRGLIRGHNLWSFNGRLHDFEGFGREKTALPDYLIQLESPVTIYSRPRPGMATLADSCYQLEKAFEAGDFADRRNVYDPLDAFFLPFDGFHQISRPGPNIKIYKRRADRDHFQFPAETPQPSGIIQKQAL